MMPVDIAVVPVAGLGTRLLPATKSQPKEMLPVGRKPIVQYVFEELTGAGMRRILFVTGQGKSSIENHFDINEELVQVLRESGKEELLAELAFERAPVQYFYTRQRQALGLGHAVLSARTFVGQQPFVVALGDSIIGLNAQSDVVARMTRAFDDLGAAAIIAVEEVAPEEAHRYGIVHPRNGTGDLFELDGLIEKPPREQAPSNLAIAARYVLSPAIFEALDQTPAGVGGEIQLTDAISRLIQQGRRVYGMRLRSDERRFDIGNFDAYFRAFVEFAIADGKHGPALRTFLQHLVHDSDS
ncbi:MAG: UTP--glucose-1-phosphate uridylyltransferase [Acidobacteria bacterium]|nr:UTP--glucose-1-phosphate uridylyltransferase [Acidobacteriota bacterium]